MRLHRWRRVVQCVSVLRRLVLQLTLVGQRAGATVAEESKGKQKTKVSFDPQKLSSSNSPVMADKLHLVATVAGLDAVDADGIAIGGVAGATSKPENKIISLQN